MNQQLLRFKQRGQLPAKLQGLSHFKLCIYICINIYIYITLLHININPLFQTCSCGKKPEWPKSQKILVSKKNSEPRTLQHLGGSVANGAHRSLEFCLRSKQKYAGRHRSHIQDGCPLPWEPTTFIFRGYKWL